MALLTYVYVYGESQNGINCYWTGIHFFKNQRSRNHKIPCLRWLLWARVWSSSQFPKAFLYTGNRSLVFQGNGTRLDPFKTACSGTVSGANFTFKLQSHFSWCLCFKMVWMKSVGYFMFYGKALWIGSFCYLKKNPIKSMNSIDRVKLKQC